MSKLRLRMIEVGIIFNTAIATVVTQPPLPLLAIPFMVIITMRSIVAMLEDRYDYPQEQ